MALALSLAVPATAGQITMTGLDAAGGSTSHNYPFCCTIREINYYDPSLFTGLSGSVTLNALGFRRNDGLSASSTFSDFEIYLSTVSAGSTVSLSDSYEDNHGANRTLVRDGALVFNNPGGFDFFAIDLDTDFVFDTTQTLVVEMINRRSVTSGFSVDAHHVATDQRGYSAVASTNPTTLRNRVAVIELTFDEVPVPGSLPMLAAALVLLAARRRF